MLSVQTSSKRYKKQPSYILQLRKIVNVESQYALMELNVAGDVKNLSIKNLRVYLALAKCRQREKPSALDAKQNYVRFLRFNISSYSYCW
jgi:hypothetical protein